MGNNSPFFIGLRFVLLLIAQALLFNNLNFFGFINPMVYVLFLYWYPIKDNRTLFISLSFLLGLAVDILSDTTALHAAATVSIAYLRPTIMRFVFGVNFEFQSFRLSNTTRIQQITFLALLIITHHIIFFSLEIFSISNLLLILKKVIFTGMASLFVGVLLRTLFRIRKS